VVIPTASASEQAPSPVGRGHSGVSQCELRVERALSATAAAVFATTGRAKTPSTIKPGPSCAAPRVTSDFAL